MDNFQDFFSQRGFAESGSQQVTPPMVEGNSLLNEIPNLTDQNPMSDVQKSQLDFMTKSIKQNAIKLSLYDKDRINSSSVDSILGGLKDTRVNTVDFDVKLDEVYTKLNDGTYIPKFENYISGTNNEERLASAQSGWEQTLNGITKGIAKTAINVMDGTVGTVVGLANGISEGSLSAVYNNDFSKFVDDLNTKLDYSLPNYYTEEQKNMGFLKSMTTANFWANDFLGGMSFMLGTLGSEAIWAYATGGASLATLSARAPLKLGASAVLKTAGKQSAKNFYKSSLKLLKAYNKTVPYSTAGKVFNNARFLYTSAGYEAGVEARHSLNESLENFVNSYETTLGRKPNAEEYSEFFDAAVDNSNKIFAANVALVGASNIAQFGSYFGVGTGLSKSLSNSIGKRLGLGIVKNLDDSGKLVYEALKPSRTQRIIGSTLDVLKAPFVEGVVEEGGQSVISKTSQNWLASRYNPNALRENFSLIDAASEAFKDTYGTKEGFKEVGLGMLIGFFGGAGRRGAQGQRTPFGVGEFSSQVTQFETNADLLNKATGELNQVQKDLLNRLVITNQFNTFVEKSKKEAEKGNLTQASIDFDVAQYSKMLVEHSADMLDESVEDFKRVIENTPNDELKNDLNLTDEQVSQYKQAVLENYQSNVELFKKSNQIAEAINPNITNLGINKTDYTQELGLNIFLGVKAAERASDIADTIDEFIGTNGTGSALKLYTNLTKKAQRRADRIVKLESEINSLDQEFLKLQQSFTASSTVKSDREGENQKVAKSLERNEAKRQKLLDTINKKKDELTELESKLENRFYKGKFSYGGNFNLFDSATTVESDLVSDIDIKNSVIKLNELDEYKKILAEQNPEAHRALNNLIEDYLKNLKAFRDFHLVYEQMSDPRFAQSQYKGVFGLFKNKGVDFKDQDLSDSPLDVRTSSLEEFLAANPNISEADKFTVETLHRMSTAFYLNIKLDDYSSPVESVTNEEWDEFNTNQEVNEVVKNRITDKLLNNTELSEREEVIYNSDKQAIDEAVQERKLEEGDTLETIITSVEPIVNRENLVDRLKDIIQRVKGSKEYLNEFNPQDINEDSKPTNKEYEEFSSLFEGLNQGNLTPKKQQRYNELKQKINNWGRLEGTLVEKGVTLSDLIEQVTLLESQQLEDKNLLPSVTDLEDIIDSKELTSSDKSGNYDNLQSYDKAFVSKDIEGYYNISNINLNGLLDIIAEDLNITVENKGKTLVKSKENWDINNLSENQRYTVKFENNGVVEKFVLRIGRGKNVVISEETKDKLNQLTSLKIFASNNLPTNFQPLLREVVIDDVTNIIPVNTNFTFYNNLQIKNEAIFNLKPNDLVYLEVPTQDEYNKKLFSKYQNATEEERPTLLKELEDNMVIYIKDKKNNFLGVHKASSKVEMSKDPNLEALQKIRKVALKRVLDEGYMENQVIDLAMSIPVSSVYYGHPNFNMVSKNGRVFVENIEFTDNAIEKVQDIGFVQNGKLNLKNDTKEVVTHPFITNILRSNKYQGKKVPIVVFEFNGNKVAYPITLKPSEVDSSVELDAILETNLSTQDKIIALNNLIIQKGLDVNKNGFSFDNFTEGHLEKVKTLLKESKDYIDPSTWMSKEEDMVDILKNQVEINIDITDKPFHSPKIKTQILNANGLDSEYLYNVEFQEILPSEMENEVNNVQRDGC